MSRLNGITVLTLICGIISQSAALAADNVATARRPTVLYSVGIKGMTCETCSAHSQKALAAVPGVVKSSVDFKSGHAWVTVEKPRSTQVSTAPPRNFAAELAAAVKRAGYKPTVNYVVTVKGMTCEACAQHITADVRKVRGVASVSVNFNGGYAVVVPAAKTGDLAKPVLAAIEQAEYKPTIHSGPQAVKPSREK